MRVEQRLAVDPLMVEQPIVEGTATAQTTLAGVRLCDLCARALPRLPFPGGSMT